MSVTSLNAINKIGAKLETKEGKEKQEQKGIAELTPQQTEGRGDCAFHASLGVWDLSLKRFICPNVATLRKQVADEIRKGTASTANRAIMEAMQQMILAERQGGKAFNLAREQFQKFLSSHESQIRATWEEFENALMVYPDIIKFINEHERARSAKDLKNKVFICLQDSENELYGLIMSLEDLHKKYKTYTEKTTQGFDWGTHLQDKELREEYAQLMERAASDSAGGYWLLPGELEIIAIVLKITIELYITDGKTKKRRISETYNPEAYGTQTVSVYFNGRNHYERMVSKPKPELEKHYKQKNPLGSRKYKQSRHLSRLQSGELTSHTPAIPLSSKNTIRGQKETYTIKYTINREEVDAILKQIGFEVPFPPGQDKLTHFVLGEGGFGEFCIGFAEKEQRYVGIKIPKRSSPVDMVKKELTLYHAIADKGFRHILPMLDFHEAWEGSDIRLYQMMPLAGLGSLDKFMGSLHFLKDTQFKEQILFCLAEGFIEGIAELHRAGFYHLDLKPANIVMQGTGEIFLIDFGSSVQSDSGVIEAMASEGDVDYYSKERWLATACGIEYEGAKADAFAAGLILLMLWNSQYSHEPIEEFTSELLDELEDLPRGVFLKDTQKIIERFEKSVTQHLSPYTASQSPDTPTVESLIAMLLHPDVGQRFTPKVAMNHPWMQKMRAGASLWREKVKAHLREFIQSEQRERRSLGPQDLPLRHFTDFVERGATQASIVKRLLTETCEKSTITLCQGMGGVGKTQLVSYILHLEVIQNHFGVKLWFRNADNPSLLDVQIIALTRELGLVADKVNPKEALEKLHAYLALESKQRGKPGIIIFDNAEEQAVLESYFPPEGIHCVVTTRNPDWKGVSVIPIDVMTEPEAETLTHKLLQKKEPETLILCKTLGFLPLGIVQACAYILAESLSISAYSELLQKESSALALLERDERSYGKKLPTSMFRMWEITFQTLSSRYPEALQCLDSLAYLSPDAIPQPLLSALGKLEVQAILQRYALLQINIQGMGSLHRLLQLVVRAKNDRRSTELLISVMRVLYKLHDSKPINLSAAIESNTQLLPHGEAICQIAEKKETSNAELLGWFSATLSWLGGLQGKIGKPHNALEYHKRALDIFEKIYGNEHPNVPRGLDNIGTAFLHLGDAKKAMEYHTNALVIYEKIYGKEHYEISQNLNNLAQACNLLGDVKSALKHHQHALAIAEKIYGNEHPTVATYLTNLGKDFLILGDTKKALEYYQRALAIREKNYDKEDLDIATSLNYVGKAFLVLGNAKKAVEHQTSALAIREKIYGKENPSVAICLRNLGEAFQALGDSKKAVGYYERALAIDEKIYGKEHPNVAINLNHLGEVFLQLGNAKKAMEYHTYALAIQEKIYGKEHPSVADSLSNLGLAFRVLGDPSKAVEYHERALAIDEKIYGKEHPHVANNLNHLGKAFLVLGNAKKAVEYHMRALAIREKICEKEHPDVAMSLNNLGEAFRALGDASRAVEYHMRALAIDEKIYGKEHPHVANSLSNLGLAFLALGNVKEGIEHLEFSLIIYEKIYGREYSSVAITLHNLGSAFLILDDAKKAVEYLEPALIIKEKIYGKGHTAVASTRTTLEFLKKSEVRIPSSEVGLEFVPSTPGAPVTPLRQMQQSRTPTTEVPKIDLSHEGFCIIL